jgi:hypothetical protein
MEKFHDFATANSRKGLWRQYFFDQEITDEVYISANSNLMVTILVLGHSGGIKNSS